MIATNLNKKKHPELMNLHKKHYATNLISGSHKVENLVSTIKLNKKLA